MKRIGDLEVPDVFAEALSVHMVYGAAGIPYADIYVIPEGCVDRETGKAALGVMAKQGDLEFIFTVGKLGMTVEEFERRWPQAVKAFRALDKCEVTRLLDKTESRPMAAGILLAMLQKGFSFRKVPPL